MSKRDPGRPHHPHVESQPPSGSLPSATHHQSAPQASDEPVLASAGRDCSRKSMRMGEDGGTVRSAVIECLSLSSSPRPSLAAPPAPIALPPAQGTIEKGQNKRSLMQLPQRLWVCPRQLPVARYGYSLPGFPGRKRSKLNRPELTLSSNAYLLNK